MQDPEVTHAERLDAKTEQTLKLLRKRLLWELHLKTAQRTDEISIKASESCALSG